VKAKEFIIDTPNVEAAKFWVGNMGKTATHGIVFAQLITPDGINRGLHSFVVPLRDPMTLQTLSGVIVGDMGHKIGLNGVDNGFAVFDRVRIPRGNLLNKHADVTPDGTYVTAYKDPNKRFGASLGSLSMGRVGITGMCVTNLKLLMPIAIRYSAVRKQFSAEEGGPEVPVMEYQLQQWRLFPYIAATYALHFFSRRLFGKFMEGQVANFTGSFSPEVLAEWGKEIHAISCASKPLASWTAQSAAQECREACGGHGYVSCNRLGMIRNDNDPNCTFEGDNNVILQQTSNYLLTAYQNNSWKTPLGSIAFLADMQHHLQRHFVGDKQEDLYNSRVACEAYQWLVAYLLNESQKKLEMELATGKDPLRARNDSQVYFCRHLSMAFVQYCAISTCHEVVWSNDVPPSLQPTLRRLSALYGLWCMEKDLGFFYQGGYMQGPQPATNIRSAILNCVRL
jgi:acyl-CoA oxidase